MGKVMGVIYVENIGHFFPLTATPKTDSIPVRAQGQQIGSYGMSEPIGIVFGVDGVELLLRNLKWISIWEDSGADGVFMGRVGCPRFTPRFRNSGDYDSGCIYKSVYKRLQRLGAYTVIHLESQQLEESF